MNLKKSYIIWTDGGCRNHGNKPGQHVRLTDKAAYAYLIKDTANGKTVKGTEGFYGKTNNQMEVLGVIRALQRLCSMKPAGYQFRGQFHVVSDSRYVDNAVNLGWLKGWEKHNFCHGRHHNKPVKNASEWKLFASLVHRFDHLDFTWTKGHSTNQGNDFVDHYLNKTMDKLPNK